MSHLLAGSASSDVTPKQPVHLFGYPHVQRTSTGVYDPLLASALCIRAADEAALFIAVDICFISKAIAAEARKRISSETGISTPQILISATHTHSGPGAVQYLSNEADHTVPPPDPDYLEQLIEGIVAAGCEAAQTCERAEIALVFADGSYTGTNRRDPSGPSNTRVPVLIARTIENKTPLAIMYVCSMHPTVLHEDSTVISADFPGATRTYLQKQHALDACPVIHHSGASGNQSPRHVISETTLAEAERIGSALGASIHEAIANASYVDNVSIACGLLEVELPVRTFIDEADARANLERVRNRYARLQAEGAPRTTLRTAECDVFGAEETLTLAKAAVEGRLQAFVETCMPAEVQRIALGPWTFIALPGELFVEYALAIESQFDNVFVITLANGELQGYIVTEEAVEEGGYEASNALFKSPESGELLTKAAVDLLGRDHSHRTRG